MLKKVTEKKLLGPLRKINGLLEEIRSGRAFASTSPPPRVPRPLHTFWLLGRWGWREAKKSQENFVDYTKPSSSCQSPAATLTG